MIVISRNRKVRFSRHRGLVALLLALTVLTLPMPRAAAADVEVTMSMAGSNRVRHGDPVTFQVGMTNTTGVAQTLTIFLSLEPADGSRPRWVFERARRNLNPGQTITSTHSVTPAALFKDRTTYHITPRDEGGTALAAPLAVTTTKPTLLIPTFSDTTAAAGLGGVTLPALVCGTWTAGAAWGDVDSDSDLDLYLPTRHGPSYLWINAGNGTFTDQAAARGLAANGGLGAVFGDQDNDGDQDLFVTGQDLTRLYENDGTGHFTDITASSGINVTGLGSQTAALGDYDNDGHLDLYVTRHSDCVGGGMGNVVPDRLYRNEGNDTFTDQTHLLGGPAADGRGFQAAFVDYDNDGDVDIYLANDNVQGVSGPNRLYRNDGPDGMGGWLFTDVSAATGANFSINAMGIGISDYDRDMDFDLAFSNIGAKVLARNDGAMFTNAAGPAGITFPLLEAGVDRITWGLDFRDFNLDGWEDLYVAQGALTSKYAHLPYITNELFINRGDGAFNNVGGATGAIGDHFISRGFGFADYNRDGRPDIYVVNQDGTPRLYKNTTSTSSHWVEIILVGTQSNRDGCGAKVILTLPDGTQLLRGRFCGSTSLGSGHDPAVHFGLGAHTEITQIEIQWPSGQNQVIPAPATKQVHTITEP
jgi:hypothetical protein